MSNVRVTCHIHIYVFFQNKKLVYLNVRLGVKRKVRFVPVSDRDLSLVIFGLLSSPIIGCELKSF